MNSNLVKRMAEKYKAFAGGAGLSLRGPEEIEISTLLHSAVEAHTTIRFRALERRIKKLEQFHCEHEFSDRDKGCTKPIFCSKCGALHPDWEWWGGMALPERDDGIWVGGKCYVPKEAP